MLIHDLQFIHITKTGGTSIEEYGCKHKIKWGCRNRDYFNKFSHIHLNQTVNKYHIPPSFFTENPYNKKTFACVRNPYTRLISEYYCPWSGSKYKHIKDKDEFNEWIQKLMLSVDVVSGLPQHLYMPINYILYFENLQNDFTKLISNIDNSICTTLPHSNKSKISNDIKYTVDDLYDDTIDLINVTYDKDFSTFNYKKI